MAKAKVVLKEQKHDDNGLSFVSNDKGDIGICGSMCIGYIADLIVDDIMTTKEVTQLLKDMVKEEKDRRGEGTWL